MFKVIIGGLLAVLGGAVATWLQARYARRIRRSEIVAEKMVATNAVAFGHMVTISSMLVQGTLKDTLNKIDENEEWFVNNRLFLPGKFPDKWLSIRMFLRRGIRLEKQLGTSSGEAAQEIADKLAESEVNLDRLAKEAIDEIYKEMELEPIKVESPFKAEGELTYIHRILKFLKIDCLIEYVCQKYQEKPKK